MGIWQYNLTNISIFHTPYGYLLLDLFYLIFTSHNPFHNN
jgi:hypothetical protein